MILHVIQFVMAIPGIKIYQKFFEKGLTFRGVHDIIMIESKEDKPGGAAILRRKVGRYEKI